MLSHRPSHVLDGEPVLAARRSPRHRSQAESPLWAASSHNRSWCPLLALANGCGRPNQLDESGEELVELVGGGLVVGAAASDWVGDVEDLVIAHAEQVLPSSARPDVLEPVVERLVTRA